MIVLPAATTNAAASLQIVAQINGTLNRIKTILLSGIPANQQTGSPALSADDFKAAIGTLPVAQLEAISAMAKCTDVTKLAAAMAAVS